MNLQTRVEKLYNAADEQLEVIAAGEMLSWKEHPCTRALLLNLEGDLEAIKEEWAQGNLTHESADATLQMNSNSIGLVQATIKMIDWIKYLDVKEDDND